jgi:hypothetical protein
MTSLANVVLEISTKTHGIKKGARLKTCVFPI